ncbi:MAG: lipopolysaccharide biosynthesis protein [Methylococcaceae bacterium]|nr:lipopolysaccharide biosynthesis protein [Methylococcaceae bacterium]
MEEKNLQDYLAAAKRHSRAALVIAGSILIIALLAAFLYPSTYRSSSTILIEEQEIPTELVKSTITTFAAQRLQTINARVMTRANLEKIIQKFDLYPKERARDTMEEVIEKMRDDISFDPISAEVIDPRTGQPSKAIIAFSLSYDGRSPGLVQRVANEITNLYLEENLKSRAQKTAETAGFLQEEARHMSEYVSQVEGKLAAFKEAHVSTLPEQKTLIMQQTQTLERDISDVDTQLRTLDERKVYLDAQLAQIKPESSTYSSTGERILSPADRLKSLKTQYLALASKYSEKHPDVVKAKQEMEAMQKEVNKKGTADADEVKQLNELRTEKAALLEKYSETHPDVIKLQQQIAALEADVAAASRAETERTVASENADNPAYITLDAQRKSIDQEASSLRQKKVELKKKLEDYTNRLGTMPDVERQYLELVRDYDNAAAKFRELKAKEMEANIAEELEKKSKGERFSVIEPPMLPEKPVKPNRIAIGFLGFILSIGAGAGYVFLLETLDKSIRGARQIAAVTGYGPLVSIPLIMTEEVKQAMDRRKIVIAAATVGAVVAALVLVHFLFSPLDVLWFRVLRKLDQQF